MKSFFSFSKRTQTSSKQVSSVTKSEVTDEKKPCMLQRSTGKALCRKSLDFLDCDDCNDDGECLTDTDETAVSSLADEDVPIMSRAIHLLACDSAEEVQSDKGNNDTTALDANNCRSTGASIASMSRVSSLRAMLEKREEDLARAELKARIVYFVSRDNVRSEAVPGLLIGPQRIRRFLKFNTFEKHITVLPDDYEMIEINTENVLSNYCDRNKLREFEIEAANSLPQRIIVSRNSSIASAECNATAQDQEEGEIVCYTARDDITVTALVGMSAGQGKMRQFLDYNKFSKEIIEIPDNYERRQLDPQLSARFYSGRTSVNSSFSASFVYDDSGNKHSALARRLSEIMVQSCAERAAVDAVEAVDEVDEDVEAVAEDLSNLLPAASESTSYRRWEASDAVVQSVLDAAAAYRNN